MPDFKIFRYELNTSKLSNGKEGPVLCLLADLHNYSYGPDNVRLADAIIAQKPDAVLVAGDLLIGQPGDDFLPALSLMRRIRKAGIPVYYGNGNHESRLRLHPERYGDMYLTYTEALRDCKVTLLENERMSFEAAGLRVTVYGFELEEVYYRKFCHRKLHEEELEKALGKPEGERYNILIAHNPIYFDAYARWGADLTVSGHLHGGIIHIPGLGGLLTPQARLFPKYDAGHFQKGGGDLVISRGLGTHTVNLRIFNPPELSVIHIKGKGSKPRKGKQPG